MTPIHRIKVSVLHGDPVVHAGLSAAIARYDDFVLVAAERDRLFDGARRVADVMVADHAHGMAAVARIRQHFDGLEPPSVLIVGNGDREWEVRRALEQGVRGYVRTGCELDELAAAIREVHRGVIHLSPEAVQRLADTLSSDALTRREQQVLHLLVNGLGNKMIARRLVIAEGTVKSHLGRIFDKLRVESRIQAIRIAERRGLLGEVDAPPPDPGVIPLVQAPQARGRTELRLARQDPQVHIVSP
jgi:DNA-binding NarL/FixJ family response regulator